MDIELKHLPKWTEQDPYSSYLYCAFKATWFKTKKLLIDELRRVDAARVTLYTSHDPKNITRDGWPRQDRQPPHPGVVLEFEKLVDMAPRRQDASGGGDSRWEKFRFPCNTYSFWEDNVRAIALALEALRKIDRYGVVTGAQYAGFKALPPAEEGTEGQTPEQAAEFVAKLAGMAGQGENVLSNPTFGELVYKTAAKAVHPDKEGGDAKQFAKLEGSMRLVREHYAGQTENNQQAQIAGGGA